MVSAKMKDEPDSKSICDDKEYDQDDSYEEGLRNLFELVEVQQKVYRVSRSACIHNGIKFQEIRSSNTIMLDMDVDARLKRITILLKSKRNGLLVYGIFPLKSDAESEDQLIRYLTLANRGLLDGCFDYDHEEGEIRYKCWLPVYAELSEEAVVSEIMTCKDMLLRYGDGLANVLLAKANPDEEIALIDGK